jgi:hypothetical protein
MGNGLPKPSDLAQAISVIKLFTSIPDETWAKFTDERRQKYNDLLDECGLIISEYQSGRAQQ